MTVVQSDRIEKQIVVRAPRARVWRALIDAQEFGKWFGVRPTSGFTPGARVSGAVTHKGYEHLTWEVTIVAVEPERKFSWRLHPGAVSASDVPDEATTLVEFELADIEGGTLVWIFACGCGAGFALTSAQSWRIKNKWFSRASR